MSIFARKLLGDCRYPSDHRTWKKSMLHLVMRLPGGMQIFETTLEDDIITRDREARDTFD